MMYYRIRFNAAPKEFIFETEKGFIIVKDLVENIRKNFKIYRDDLEVYCGEGVKLQLKDSVENGRTYIIKRKPSNRVIYRKRKLRY